MYWYESNSIMYQLLYYRLTIHSNSILMMFANLVSNTNKAHVGGGRNKGLWREICRVRVGETNCSMIRVRVNSLLFTVQTIYSLTFSVDRP